MSVQFQVGDKVIVRMRSRYHFQIDPEPIVTEVVRVSKTGQPSIKVEEPDPSDRTKTRTRKVRFNPRDSWTCKSMRGIGVVGEKRGLFEKAALFHYSEELLAELKASIEAEKAAKEEKKQANEKKARERENREEEKMRIFRDACKRPDGISELKIVLEQTMPDGSRFYTIQMPVNPEYVDRKKGWEMTTVHCWDGKKLDFRQGKEVDRVEYAYTFCNGSSGSFSSCSTCYAVDDTEALWEAAKDVYFHW